jgi:hypothetical protein
MLKYLDITQNTFVQSWTVTEIMSREKCGLLAGPRSVPISWQVLSKFVRECGVRWRLTHSRKLHMCFLQGTMRCAGSHVTSVLAIRVSRIVLGTLRTTMTWRVIFWFNLMASYHSRITLILRTLLTLQKPHIPASFNKYLVINKCVTPIRVSNFSDHYLHNLSTLDISGLGYIGIL